MATLAAIIGCTTLSWAQQAVPRAGPPVPFEDPGACPFELCTYGEWTAREPVVVRRELYLLTYQGEGFTKAWFDGRLYDELDGSEFFNAACEDDPGRCAGRIVEKPLREWWAQVRNAAGSTGWTDEPHKFSQSRAG